MRIITKDIQLTVGGSPSGFRLTKPDAFSGAEILRLLLRLQNAKPEENSSVLDLITSLSSDELRSFMTSCLNHTEVLLPAGPHPVMTGSEWGYPELKHDTVSCMKLVLEEITWALEGFFGGGGPDSLPADATTPRPSARTSTGSSSSRWRRGCGSSMSSGTGPIPWTTCWTRRS